MNRDQRLINERAGVQFSGGFRKGLMGLMLGLASPVFKIAPPTEFCLTPAKDSRKLCYRKDDRAMRTIYKWIV